MRPGPAQAPAGHARAVVLVPEPDEELSGVDKLEAKFWELWMETEEARSRSFSEQLGILFDRFGSTESLALGVAINTLTIAIGVAVYWLLSGPLAYAGVFVAILGVLGILSGVLRL